MEVRKFANNGRIPLACGIGVDGNFGTWFSTKSPK
jgi:hypothetical protein